MKSAKILSHILAFSIALIPLNVTAEIHSKTAEAARDDARKLIAGLEVNLQAAEKKRSWLEVLEISEIITRMDLRNPQVGSSKGKALDAFLTESIGKQANAKTKALDGATAKYAAEISKLLASAKKKGDLIGMKECLLLLSELDPENKKLQDAKKKVTEAVAQLAPDDVKPSGVQTSAQRARSRYSAGMSRALKQYESQGADLAALAAAKKMQGLDHTSGDAKRVMESVAGKIQTSAIEKARKKKKSLPHLKRAESVFEKFVKTTVKRMKAAKIRKDSIGVLQCTKLILQVDPDHQDAKKMQKETRDNLIRAAQVLGKPIKEEHLVWYKIVGKFAFDGDLIAFNSGALGIGPMATDVVITGEMKAHGMRWKYGWGQSNSSGSGGAERDPRFDGRQWVKFAVVATRRIGFWQIEEKVYRQDGCGFKGRLIIYPGGQTELRGVRVYRLK